MHTLPDCVNEKGRIPSAWKGLRAPLSPSPPCPFPTKPQHSWQLSCIFLLCIVQDSVTLKQCSCDIHQNIFSTEYLPCKNTFYPLQRNAQNTSKASGLLHRFFLTDYMPKHFTVVKIMRLHTVKCKESCCGTTPHSMSGRGKEESVMRPATEGEIN